MSDIDVLFAHSIVVPGISMESSCQLYKRDQLGPELMMSVCLKVRSCCLGSLCQCYPTNFIKLLYFRRSLLLT